MFLGIHFKCRAGSREAFRDSSDAVRVRAVLKALWAYFVELAVKIIAFFLGWMLKNHLSSLQLAAVSPLYICSWAWVCTQLLLTFIHLH